MDDPKQILVEREGHVARVTINRPNRRNALSLAAWQSLAAAFDNLAADPVVRVVVLTGAGERAFCAGNDISEFAEKRSTPEQIEAYDVVFSHAHQVIRNFEKPLLARVRGFAVGGGFELMQLCDIQIASAGARFAMTPARLGLGYKLADVQLLVDRIGPRAAREMLFTGRLFDADEAERLGFVTRVVPDEDLDATVDACAAEIAANAPLSVQAIKVAIGEAGEAAVGTRPGPLQRPRRRLRRERGLSGKGKRRLPNGARRSFGGDRNSRWHRRGVRSTCELLPAIRRLMHVDVELVFHIVDIERTLRQRIEPWRVRRR